MKTTILSITMIAVASVASADPPDCSWVWVNPTPPRHDIHRLKFENNRFIAVGADGIMLRSLDGLRWEVVDGGVAGDLHGVDWGVGWFVVVGEGVILRSGDGRVWTPVVQDPDVTFLDVEYSASRFVAVGAGLDGRVLTSSFGETWEEVSVPWGGSADSITGTDSGFAVAIGPEIWSSGDGYDWSYEGSVPVVETRAAECGETKAVSSDLFELDRVDLAWT